MQYMARSASMHAPILLLTLVITLCDCRLYNLQDAPSTRPGLATGDPNDPPERLVWSEGGPAFALASAGAVRINARGIILYPPTARVRSFSSQSGWHSVTCNVSAWALCSSDIGHVFPSTAPRMPERRAAIQVDGWADLGCSDSVGKILTTLGVYDVSACDVLDEGLDVLYYASTIAHRHSEPPLWKYWTMVILSIVLVRNLSYNIQDLWQRVETPSRWQAPALVSSLVLLILVLVDGDSAFVTSADQLFFWSTAGYIIIYLVLHAFAWFSHRKMLERGEQAEELLIDDNESMGPLENTYETPLPVYEKPVYNIIVATLQLVAMHFYSSAQTPYNTILLGILACRGW